MASEFQGAKDRCHGRDCNRESTATYLVRENQNLCPGCAVAKASWIKPRKKIGAWYCDKHEKRIIFYCKSHNCTACPYCALVRHKHCQLEDLDDALAEKRAQLRVLGDRIARNTLRWQEHCDVIKTRKLDSSRHLNTVMEDIDSLIDGELGKVHAEAQNELDLIRFRADDEIRKITQRRDAELQQVNDNAETKCEPIEGKRLLLRSCLENIKEKVEERVEQLESDARKQVRDLTEASERIDILLQQEKNLLIETDDVIRSISDEVDKEVSNAIEHFSSMVEDVKLLVPTGDNFQQSRIDWHGGRWQLIDTVEVPSNVSVPSFAGCINEANVVISDRHLKTSDAYVLSLNSGQMERVIEGDKASYVVTCSPLKDGMMICGKALNGSSGDMLRSCISLYNQHWGFVRNIDIPRNTRTLFTLVDVYVGKDGKILAAESSQPNIYVIDPIDFKIVSMMKCINNIRLRGVLSSGCVVAQNSPPDNKLLIVNRDGIHQEIVHSGIVLNCAVDPFTDELYIISSDTEYKVCVINQLSSSGVLRKGAVPLPIPTKLRSKEVRRTYLQNYRLTVTSSGKLFASSGEKFRVFEREFAV